MFLPSVINGGEESSARGACKTTSLVARCKREKEKGEEFQAVQVQVLLLVERQQRGRNEREEVLLIQ